jgi:hypothetical protein
MNQSIIISILPVFFFIYDVLFTLWNILQKTITEIKNYTLIVYNFMCDFIETVYDKGLDNNEPISPKTSLIDNSWCNIDPNNIIDNKKII